MKKKILHMESSPGWGGQEIRVLKEAEGMRSRGHEVILVIQRGGGLVDPARKAGFIVYELDLHRGGIFSSLIKLYKIIYKHKIDLINTHSSFDAWLGGFVGKLLKRTVIRTRHLSTPIKSGLNSIALYNWLADGVITTCQAIVPTIIKQAKLKQERCISIPTGVDTTKVSFLNEEVLQFKEKWGIKSEEIVLGTLCILRSWKGISDLLQAADLLRDVPNIKWLIVGDGVSEHYFREECRQLHLKDKVIFTGYMDKPFVALSAMDVFLLLSRSNEGVSQASLQAAYLKKPMITTTVGGLPEVCLNDKTGYNVAVKAPHEVAEAVRKLINDAQRRLQMGELAHDLVNEKFTFEKMLDGVENFYNLIRSR